MNKTDLIAAVAAKTQTSKAECGRIIDGFIDALTESIVQNEKTDIHGFASFKRTTRKARVGRNPATGESIDIPAKVTVRMVQHKALKDAVNM